MTWMDVECNGLAMDLKLDTMIGLDWNLCFQHCCFGERYQDSDQLTLVRHGYITPMARKVFSELFVSRLSFYTTTEELTRLFSPFGLVEQVRLIKDPRTQRPKGFGFVKFASEVDAQNAQKAMNGRIVDGRLIFVEVAETAELMSFSQSSCLLLPQFQLRTSRGRQLPNGQNRTLFAVTSAMCVSSTRLAMFPTSFPEQKQHSWMARASVISDSKVPTTFTVDSAGEGIDIPPDSGGSDDNFGGRGRGGGGGGGGGGGDHDNSEGGSDESEDRSGGSEKKGMSMSQKLTLGYAALVGIGGVMGYVKGGSQKSLIAGGLSASLLYYVYTLLPSNPVLASSLGLGLSAALLGVMGSRFKKSGKIFPAVHTDDACVLLALTFSHFAVGSKCRSEASAFLACYVSE
ncbi:hypothetical protein BUALT_Bualt04G0011500 [Buddleja alternifolia]|uniref:RRM domain-containing protein n=1 Tax=Buddleja alternifolia TaxID=168488 RepID=A0AAV6XW14_9LAMI|nr:hypothetical protein BUALT_Bualt04G0011500 [Buddleja alternifolia]